MADEKMRILYLMKILLDETDKDHILDAIQLGQRMEARYNVKGTNRKTIYADIKKLRSFGLHIEQIKGFQRGYYISEREFSLPELKLLVDAVQSSKFITVQKSEELIKKLESFTSRENAKQLQRQVYIYNRPKTSNETIYLNVDTIHQAIHSNKQVLFKYCEWSKDKALVQKKNGEDYVVSPWSLSWDDENYYLVAYDNILREIRHYRVDKIQEIRISSSPRMGKEIFEHFDLASFSKKTFGMFAGRDEVISLHCDDRLIGVILDRFGTDIIIMPAENGYFITHVKVTVSPQFYGWVTGIGKDLQILGPDPVREEYIKYITEIQKKYHDTEESNK